MVDQRGNIAQFNAGEGAFKATDEGAHALSEAGYMEGKLYRQAGEDAKQGVENLGKPFAEMADQHAFMDEVSTGSATWSTMLNNNTQAWNKIASQPGAAQDKTLQEKFLNDTLEPQLQQFQNGFTTERGQNWALSRADDLRQEFFKKTSADMSTLAGEGRLQDFKTNLNQLAATTYRDPSSTDAAFAHVDETLKAVTDNTQGQLTPEQIAKFDTLAADMKNEIAKNTVKGLADNVSPEKAKAVLDSGTLDKYIPANEQAELHQYIASQKIAREVQAQQQREQQQYKEIQVNEKTTHDIFSDISSGKMISATTAFSAKGLSPQQRADFISSDKSNPGILMLPRSWLTSPEFGPGFTETAEALQRGEGVTPAGLTKGVRMYVTNPAQAITPAGAARLQEIQDKMKTPEGAYEVQMQNSVLDNLKDQLTVGGRYATDQKGKEIYSGMQNTFYTLWDSEIKSGKKPADLANPDSKEYIGNAFMTMKRTPAQGMADVINTKPGDEKDFLTQLDNANKQKSAPTITTKEQRDKLQPGEYYKRNGQLFQVPQKGQ